MTRILRHAEVRDYDPTIRIFDGWFEGPRQADKLHRLFFEQVRPTNFELEENEKIAGFVRGFRSQTTPTHAYIHFVGIHPAIGRRGADAGLQISYVEMFCLEGTPCFDQRLRHGRQHGLARCATPWHGAAACPPDSLRLNWLTGRA
jgi:hypothetical protein